MTIEAHLLRGKTNFGGDAPRLTENETGASGTRHYRINVMQEAKALDAIGFPKIGDPWDSGFTNLKVVSREVEQVGGIPYADGSGEGGWMLGKVEYATPGLNGRLPAPTDGDAFTLIRPNTTSINRRWDVRKSNSNLPAGWSFLTPTIGAGEALHDLTTQIAGGKGTQISVGQTQATVIQYLPAESIDFTRLIRLQRFQAVNVAAVNLPRIYLSDASWTMAKGQLQYSAFEVEEDRGKIRLTHILNMAPDFFGRDQAEDENGDATGPTRVHVDYAAAPFAGLWPGA